jgi:DNA processing protein
MKLPAERDAWVILATTDGIGPETMAALLAEFGAARSVLAAARGSALLGWARRRREVDGRWPLTRPVLDNLAAWPHAGGARLARLADLGLWTLTPLDAEWPPPLRDLDPPPPLVVGSGDLALLSGRRAVAVVGTRRPTPHGRALAARIATRLAESGTVVISGGAIGIDGAAHAASLDKGGATVAVIGGGHLQPGPRAHAALRARIEHEGGAIISEHDPAVVPRKGTYPRRNRVIAALAEATVVVEAPRRSGALITARVALELGRPVYVTPGRIGDWAIEGSLELLRSTPARLVSGVDELADDLALFDARASRTDSHGVVLPAVPGARRAAALAVLEGAQRAVAERLCRAPAALDTLAEETGLPAATVSGAVTLLLMRGWIQPIGPAYLPAGPLLD